MKSLKLCEIGRDRDRISNLHEDVLSDILSRLPIKDAVQTSILSKSWEHKWTLSYNVDIDDLLNKSWHLDTHLKPGMFANFVDRTLHSCKHVKQLGLRCRELYDLERVQSWISAALRHKLETVKVDCGVKGTVYPSSLVNSSSLRKLEMSNCTLNVAAKNIAVNLTSFILYKVKIVNGNPNTSTVAYSFPVLETFKVLLSEWLNVKSVEIDAPLLTKFFSAVDNDTEECPYTFVITAPRLAYFESWLGFPEKFILDGGSSSIVSAKISGARFLQDRELLARIGTVQINKLLNQLKKLEFLEMSCYIVEVSQLGLPLCCYENLTSLVLLGGEVNPGILCHMLHAAPSLKLLKVSCVDDECEWEVEPVPSCIVSQLEEVDILLGHPIKSDYNMVKFLLKNGKRLKRICLGGSDKVKVSLARLKAIDTLLSLPRRSPNVIIEG